MASQFVKAAKFQTILFLWMMAAPTFALLIYRISSQADANNVYFWIGIAAMITGYALLVRSKWDQIQARDFFTWGLSPSMRKYKSFYLASYLFMFCGFMVAGSSGII